MDFPWYRSVGVDDDVSQGDILRDCPVVRAKVPDNMIGGTNTSIEGIITFVDGIVMTQACDLANKKVKNVVVCPVMRLNDFVLNNPDLCGGKLKDVVMSILGGKMPALMIINKPCENGISVDDYMIVDFRDIFSVPLDIIKSVVTNDGRICRLLPPYREAVSHAFANYFARVGLPSVIDKSILSNYVAGLASGDN